MTSEVNLNKEIALTMKVTLQKLLVRSERYCRIVLDHDADGMSEEWQNRLQEEAKSLVAEHCSWEEETIDAYVYGNFIEVTRGPIRRVRV